MALKKLTPAVFILLCLISTGCPSDSGSADPAEKTALNKLSKTWNIATAELDGTDRTSDFSGFTLTISGTFNGSTPEGPYSYSVSGSRPQPSPWPQSGTWTFGGSPQSSITRDDGVEVSYAISSTGVLTMEFECVTCSYPGARVNAVSGVWSFEMN